MRTLAMAALGTVLCVVTAIAQEKTTARDNAAKEPENLREMIDAAVDQVEVLPNRNATEAAKPLVVLRWANNQRGSEDGLTILYIHEGRPLATACLYPWAGKLVHDFEAIGREPPVARRQGDPEVVWTPKTTGVVFADIPDAPRPEATPAQRLRQLKTLAEQFQSTMLGWKHDDSDREELRLLPRPLYRYEVKEGPVLDGAVFGFVMGTDPETLLLIEAIGKGESARWQFAFARRTSGELEGRHRDKVVWHADRFPETKDPLQPRFGVGTPIPTQFLDALREE